MNAHRANIISTLQLIASPTEAMDYQAKVPRVNLASELVCHWFDDFYHSGSVQFKAAFTGPELAELELFHRFFDERADTLPDGLTALLASPIWKQISADADSVLARLGWTDLVAKYDD